jgi:hypothetical protein
MKERAGERRCTPELLRKTLPSRFVRFKNVDLCRVNLVNIAPKSGLAGGHRLMSVTQAFDI